MGIVMLMPNNNEAHLRCLAVRGSTASPYQVKVTEVVEAATKRHRKLRHRLLYFTTSTKCSARHEHWPAWVQSAARLQCSRASGGKDNRHCHVASNYYPTDYLSLFPVALALMPTATLAAGPRILLIGGGASVLPQTLAAQFPSSPVDVVEPDWAVVSLAKEFFGFVYTQGEATEGAAALPQTPAGPRGAKHGHSERNAYHSMRRSAHHAEHVGRNAGRASRHRKGRVTLHIDDGRSFVRRALRGEPRRKWDVIVLDACARHCLTAASPLPRATCALAIPCEPTRASPQPSTQLPLPVTIVTFRHLRCE